MGRKFELYFVLAKESISFTKCLTSLQLEDHHGVDSLVPPTERLTPRSHLLAQSIIKITPLLSCMYDMTGQFF